MYGLYSLLALALCHKADTFSQHTAPAHKAHARPSLGKPHCLFGLLVCLPLSGHITSLIHPLLQLPISCGSRRSRCPASQIGGACLLLHHRCAAAGGRAPVRCAPAGLLQPRRPVHYPPGQGRRQASAGSLCAPVGKCRARRSHHSGFCRRHIHGASPRLHGCPAALWHAGRRRAACLGCSSSRRCCCSAAAGCSCGQARASSGGGSRQQRPPHPRQLGRVAAGRCCWRRARPCRRS